jgi:hypothetical protein
MIIQLQNSALSIIEQNTYLPFIPRWGLRELSLMIGPYENGQEHEQHFLETRGSGNWYRSEFEEFRFTKNDYILTSIWFHIPEINKKPTDIINLWLGQSSIKGLLKIDQINSLQPEAMDFRHFDPQGKFLVCFNEIALEDHPSIIKLNIAKDFYLFFTTQKLCGWMLVNPIHYLTEKWNNAYNTSYHPLIVDYLFEYLQLIAQPFIEEMEDENQDILQQILTLKKGLFSLNEPSSQTQVILNCINDILEQFYDYTDE